MIPIAMTDATGKTIESAEIKKMYDEIQSQITAVLDGYNLTLGQASEILREVASNYEAMGLSISFSRFVSCD